MIKNRKQYLRNVIAAFVLVLGLMMSTTTPQAQSGNNLGNPGVIPPNAKPYGMSYGEWSAKWWTWVFTIPTSINPNLDPAADCSNGQLGPVWFLPAVIGGGTLTRSCKVPAGKALLFPVLSSLVNYPCPFPNYEPAPGQSLKDFLTETAKTFDDNFITDLEVEVDGVPLRNLFRYRATSDLFYFAEDPSIIALDPCFTGLPQPFVADGYWIMLAPLSVGNHTIHIRPRTSPLRGCGSYGSQPKGAPA